MSGYIDSYKKAVEAREQFRNWLDKEEEPLLYDASNNRIVTGHIPYEVRDAVNKKIDEVLKALVFQLLEETIAARKASARNEAARLLEELT